MNNIQARTGINAWIENTQYAEKKAGMLNTIGKGISNAGKFMQRIGQQTGKFVKNNLGNSPGSLGKQVTNFMGKHRIATGIGVLGGSAATAYGGYKMLSNNNNN